MQFWNTSYGKFLISQRVLKWITKTSTLCIVAVAYTPQVYFLVTFLKKKKKKEKKANLQAQVTGAFRSGKTIEVCRNELQGFDMLS